MEPVYTLAKGVFIPPLRLGLRWTIEGAHLLPPKGPIILASNHHSYLDPLTLAYVADRRDRRVRFLAKAELFEKRGLGPLLRSIHQIPVERGTKNSGEALDAAIEAIAQGECVAVFPEGTISLDLDPMPGKSGAARLARATGAPVLPVGLWGTHRILFKGRKPRWRVGVPQVAVVRPALHIASHDHVREATDRIMDEICACVRRARELYPERPGADEDQWWWRDPDTAQLRSVRGSPGRPRDVAIEETA